MKKSNKIVLITLIIIISIIAVLGILFYMYLHTTTGIVVGVNEHSLLVTGTGNVSGLFFVGFADDGNIGFKQGQEILIYFNGDVMQTYPAQLGKARKIIVLKEKSEKEIPKEDLKYYYSSTTKVSPHINEITPTSLTITITDTNEMPYEYYADYKIYKEEYITREVDKISNISTKDTATPLIYNLPSMTEDNSYTVVGWKFDWSNLYGTLGEGNYSFGLQAESFTIFFKFAIDKNGQVSHEKPVIM